VAVEVLVAAPPTAVAGALRDAEAVAEALGRRGHRFRSPARLLAPGDEVRLAARVLPGVRLPLRTRITHLGADGIRSVRTGGPLRALRHAVTLTEAPGGTLVRDELRWVSPLGPLGRLADLVLVRHLMRGVLAARADVLPGRAVAVAAAPAVVAAALVRDGRLLVAQRTRPPALAGLWELPGGRVEPGEDERAAVARELREELGTQVEAAERVGTDLPIAVGTLRVYRARPAPGAAEPVAREHAAVRWVDAAEVPGVAWVDADRAVVADLIRLLGGG
jgi:8-oxo-dGTP diphosphatase